MSRANILNTRTINYLELIGNGKGYRVPPYQRDYSWSEEQWEDLWNDVLELRGRPDDRHYMGALVVEGTRDREFLIIDGQQRMATLSILALAVIGKLRAMADRGVEPAPNRERANELRNRFICHPLPLVIGFPAPRNSRGALDERSRILLADFVLVNTLVGCKQSRFRGCTSTSGSTASPMAYRLLCVRFTALVHAPHSPLTIRALRRRCNTRYGWVVSPYPTGTRTPQDTPSFAWHNNVSPTGAAPRLPSLDYMTVPARPWTRHQHRRPGFAYTIIDANID